MSVSTGRFTVEKGRPHPLGATPDKDGTNFSVFSENATGVELLLFDRDDSPDPIEVISFDPTVNNTFHFWHVYVKGAKPGMHYAYRVDGPFDPANGHRFNKNKVLIDPYAKGNNKNLWNRGDACEAGDNLKTSMRSVIIDTNDYDWEGDKILGTPMSDTIIYEMNVGGFTKSPKSKVKHPGTFRGLTEKISYLKELGVNAVELLPVFEFDDTEVLRYVDGKPLTNYWGYSTMSYFAPHPSFCVNPEAGDHVREFRDMVKALHKAGIQVILDVVFNHTDEGNEQGPVFSFKGFDNKTYYYLVPEDKQYYYDYTGCGNTFNCNHPVGEKLILDCLRYWVKEMHVDGFRFDEGSVLSRGEDGAPMEHPPVIWAIELDDILADAKVIAEAWDAAGLYQIGYFPGYRWAEWNGRYRDDVRKFVKGDPGLVGTVAGRITGSSDLYQARGHFPVNSINFIVAHDGFTLNDMVSYNEKHNYANGENNNDGIDDNLSWNCGVEGETEDAGINSLRERQIKNFATILMVSQGVPMMVMGDEVRRTQYGNNNTYCHDNELGWFNWDDVEKNKEMFRFWKILIARRKFIEELHRPRYFTGEKNKRGIGDIDWHGCQLHSPGWDDPNSRVLAFTMGDFDDQGGDVHVMMNMYWEALEFELPDGGGMKWYRAIDTAQDSPNDIAEIGKEIPITGNSYLVSGRSVVMLVSK